MKGLVIPANIATPCRVVEWTDEDSGELLELLYREIDCRTVEAFGLPDGTTVWCDEDAWQGPEPMANFRVQALVEAAGRVLAGPVVGNVVLTGGPDEDGRATGLTEEFLDAVERELAR